MFKIKNGNYIYNINKYYKIFSIDTKTDYCLIWLLRLDHLLNKNN